MNLPPGSIEATVSRAYYNPQQKTFLTAELLYLVPIYRFNVLNQQLSKHYPVDKGRPVQVVAILGTLPVRYQGNIFNVPVQIVYYDGYPMLPPVVQVVPTPEMMIKPNEFVREDGVVTSDILKRWNSQCNTKALLDDLIAAFSYKMPVFGRTPGTNRQTQPAPANRQTQPTPAIRGLQPMQGTNLTLPLREQFELKASELISELEVLEKDRLALMNSADSIKQVKSTLREEQSQANSRLAALDQAKTTAFQWVSANSAVEAATMSLDQLLPLENPLSASLLQSLACEQAYEETSNALVEGFGMRRCSTEDFIRSLKSIYRDMFLELQRKERAMQMLKAGR
jgi:hypothetical protein